MAIQDRSASGQIQGAHDPKARHFGPAPLWILGHNTNSIEEVQAALDQGANAVEIDVTAYADDLNALCIDHAGIMGDAPGGASAPAFEPFLHDLRKLVDARPELCLVMFDLKPPASHARFGPVLIDTIRRILTHDTTLSIILSVANVTASHSDRPAGSTVFDAISGDVRAREGFMIDEDSSVDDVVSFFSRKHVSRMGYGYGTAFPLIDEGARAYRTPIEKACWMRVAHGRPGFVEAWTVNSVDNLKLYLGIGVNGLICDPQGIDRVRDLLRHSEFSTRYRPAQRFDDPMAPDNFGYGLTVVTSSVGFAGTDAKITFTVHGDKGAASVTVDTHFRARMESGSTNFVVLHSPDLGDLQSITVQSDVTHIGPGWHLASITVESARYGGKKTASFDSWIESTKPITKTLS
jgi:glycerophosphoryl diester phosphodiesterase